MFVRAVWLGDLARRWRWLTGSERSFRAASPALSGEPGPRPRQRSAAPGGVTERHLPLISAQLHDRRRRRDQLPMERRPPPGTCLKRQSLAGATRIWWGWPMRSRLSILRAILPGRPCTASTFKATHAFTSKLRIPRSSAKTVKKEGAAIRRPSRFGTRAICHWHDRSSRNRPPVLHGSLAPFRSTAALLTKFAATLPQWRDGFDVFPLHEGEVTTRRSTVYSSNGLPVELITDPWGPLLAVILVVHRLRAPS